MSQIESCSFAYSSRRVAAGSILAMRRAGTAAARSVTAANVSATAARVRSIVNADAVKDAAHDAQRSQAGDEACREAQRRGSRSGRADMRHGLADAGAERDADADFAGALRHHAGHQRKDAHGAQQQGKAGHGAQQGNFDALCGQGLRQQIFHAVKAGRDTLGVGFKCGRDYSGEQPTGQVLLLPRARDGGFRMKPKLMVATLMHPKPGSAIFVNCDKERECSCERGKRGKEEYASRADAEAHIREMAENRAPNPEDLEAYPCRYGRHWHIGHRLSLPSDGSVRIVDGR